MFAHVTLGRAMGYNEILLPGLLKFVFSEFTINATGTVGTPVQRIGKVQFEDRTIAVVSGRLVKNLFPGFIASACI